MMTDLQAFALTLYGEVRGEPIEGQVGVAMVIRNRVLEQYRGQTTYAGVCLDPAQFSCWTEEKKLLEETLAEWTNPHVTLDTTLGRLVEIADATMQGKLADNTKNANHYLVSCVYEDNPPAWAKGVPVLVYLGDQAFLRCP